jgi:probable F420-dependent oxidoreductase
MDPLNGTGIWSAPLRYGDRSVAADASAELEALGYSALWIPDVGGNVFAAIENLLQATSSVTIATGILNLWMHEADETAGQHARLTAAHGRRLLLGIGVSHAPLIDNATPRRYEKPLAEMRTYLDGIDAAPVPVPVDERVLAALGPKMLALAGERTAGTHPYLVTPEHTAVARAALGPDKLVLPEQAVVLETDPETARTIARSHLAGYLGLPNYTNNWKRLGFTDDDLADGGSDRLVDAFVVWGDEETIMARVDAHRDAGADHVCVQVLTHNLMEAPLAEWRTLAPALTAT